MLVLVLIHRERDCGRGPLVHRHGFRFQHVAFTRLSVDTLVIETFDELRSRILVCCIRRGIWYLKLASEVTAQVTVGAGSGVDLSFETYCMPLGVNMAFMLWQSYRSSARSQS